MRNKKLEAASEAFMQKLMDSDTAELPSLPETVDLCQAVADSIVNAFCPMRDWELPFILYVLEACRDNLMNIFPDAVGAANDMRNIFYCTSYNITRKKKPPVDLAESADGKGEE